MARPTILILNAGLGGRAGNTAVYLGGLANRLARTATVDKAVLRDGDSFADLRSRLAKASALVIGTGTHWDSWSSLLQTFLEDATESEGTALWLGKPVGVVVTEHSVGGKDVLGRLQAVLSTFGCLIPPMSGVVLSRVAQIAGKTDAQAAQDFWCPEDLAVVAHNLLVATTGKGRWKSWPVDRVEFGRRWVK